jgi:two-component system NtrC family sensor kinase
MAAALQERERRLIRGERLAAVGQLAAQVTHEIRNPLSSVALNVELLADEIAATSPEAHQLLAKITTEIDRLTSITEDYLGFVRRKNPERVPLDLSAELTASSTSWPRSSPPPASASPASCAPRGSSATPASCARPS